MRPEQTRTYDRASSIVFLKTDAPFGGLSNMAGGFPLWVNGIRALTSEALYQACRFPHLPEVQSLIIEQKSPMAAKIGRPIASRTMKRTTARMAMAQIASSPGRSDAAGGRPDRMRCRAWT